MQHVEVLHQPMMKRKATFVKRICVYYASQTVNPLHILINKILDCNPIKLITLTHLQSSPNQNYTIINPLTSVDLVEYNIAYDSIINSSKRRPSIESHKNDLLPLNMTSLII